LAKELVPNPSIPTIFLHFIFIIHSKIKKIYKDHIPKIAYDKK